MSLIKDSDAVCVACRWRFAHAPDCPRPAPWPMIEVDEPDTLSAEDQLWQ